MLRTDTTEIIYILLSKKINIKHLKAESSGSSIVKLSWTPIKEPKIRKELQKSGCKATFTSATKLKNKLYKNKSKSLCLRYKLRLWVEIYCRNKKNVCSLDQLNIKKIA